MLGIYILSIKVLKVIKLLVFFTTPRGEQIKIEMSCGLNVDMIVFVKVTFI